METKALIIQTALSTFMEKGYDNTTLNDVAEKIGITKPALYYHFKNKEELFNEVMDTFLNYFEEIMCNLEVVTNFQDVLQKMYSSLQDYIIFLKQYTHLEINNDDIMLKYYYLIYDAIKRNENFRKRINLIYGKNIKNLEVLIIEAQENGEINKNIDCRIFAFQIIALIKGTFILSIFDPSIDLQQLGTRMYENWWSLLERQ